MTDKEKEKKPNYYVWMLIAAAVLVIALGIGFYMLWRKLTASDLKAATLGKTVDDMRLKMVQAESDSKSKDDKLAAITKELSEVKNENTNLKYQVRDFRKSNTSKSRSTKKTEDGNTVVTDIEDL